MRRVKTTFFFIWSEPISSDKRNCNWQLAYRHVTLGHRRFRAQLKFWFGQNCIDMISHRIFPRTTQGYKGGLNAKSKSESTRQDALQIHHGNNLVLQKQNGKKRDRKSIPKPRKHTMKQYDLLARQSVVYWKFLASFLLTAMKAITHTTPRGGNLPQWCN